MEELIKRLERVIATGAPDKDGQHPITAEVVLELVKQLSEHGTNLAEVGTDCISRQAAIDAVMECYDKDELLMVYVWKLNELPQIQPDRIKGHWIEIALSNHTYKCSVCGRLLVNITDGKNNVAKKYPYCHCGADMRGEQDG